MKRILLAAIAMIAIIPAASAQAAPGITYDLTAKKVVFGATYDVGATLHDVLGRKGFDLTIRPLAGVTNDGGLTAGGVFVAPINVSRELRLDLGLGGRVGAGEKPHAYVYLGFGWRV